MIYYLITPDKLQTKVIEHDYDYAYESKDLNADSEVEENGETITPFREISAAVVEYVGINEFTGGAQRWTESIRELVKVGATPEIIQNAVKLLRNKRYAITGPWSLINTTTTLVGEQRGIKPSDPYRGYELVS